MRLYLFEMMKIAFLCALAIAGSYAACIVDMDKCDTICDTDAGKSTAEAVCELAGELDLCDEAVYCKNDICFPGSASVTLESGEAISMRDLKTGHKVSTGKAASDVYLFTTSIADVLTSFVKVETASASVMLTPGHYLYVNGELKTADSVKVGDKVTLADGSDAEVTAVSTQWEQGLFNPHTLDGDIVVDGILTSTYTNAVEPSLAHAILWPLRQMYSAGIDMSAPFARFAKSMPSNLQEYFGDARY